MKDEFHPTIASSITPNIQFPPHKKQINDLLDKKRIYNFKEEQSFLFFIYFHLFFWIENMQHFCNNKKFGKILFLNNFFLF
jgi:hypothetical protein